MNLERWLASGAIKPYVPQQTQITNLLDSARSDIDAAEDLQKLGHYGISRDTAYEAMLKSGMALMFHHGYRPESGSHHAVIVNFTGQALAGEQDDLTLAFDRLRRSRHQRLYQGKEVGTQSQAKAAIAHAKRLLEIVVSKT